MKLAAQLTRWPTLASLTALTILATWIATAQSQVVYETHSDYNTIVVTQDQDGLRTLLFEHNGARQSVVKLDDPSHIELPYVRATLVGLALVPNPQRILVIGLGGGSIPSFLHHHYPNATINVVDIDPEVVRVAKQFFGLQTDERLQTHVADGRKFVEETTQPYDLIFLDAYGADSIPYHLATIEFLHAVRKALSPQGVVVGNIWSRISNPLYAPMVSTYQEGFDRLYILDVRGAGNLIFFALPQPRTLDLQTVTQSAADISRTKMLPFNLADELANGFSLPSKSSTRARILHDSDQR
jgi:spermidine synthase